MAYLASSPGCEADAVADAIATFLSCAITPQKEQSIRAIVKIFFINYNIKGCYSIEFASHRDETTSFCKVIKCFGL
jgi:hypothetical protein